jgi:periplasmic protein TonB
MNGIGAPVCVYCPPPEYSERARADKLQGSVLLDILVTLEGKATKIIVVKGLGEGLDEKAIEAVKSWKFKPAKDATGTPVAVRTQVHVTFHLGK